VSNPKSKNFPNCFKSPDNIDATFWSSTPGADMTYNNGAVLTFWFHLLCNGGSGNVDDKPTKPPYSVSSIGMDKATKIVVRAIRYYSFNLIGFEQFRRATIESAKDLYGNCSSEVLQTAAAWRAVGLDEFFNYYVAPPTDLCNNFGGTQNSYQIYYIQNTVPLPSMACSPQNLVVKSGSTLVVTSAQSIILKPGFKAEAGCQFKAITTSCLTQTLREGNQLEENFIHSENFNNYINTWSVTPNPSQEQNLKLNYPNDRTLVQITLTDIQGKIIQENLQFEQSNQGVAFTSENLQKGVYFLHATTIEGEQKTLKLIRY
jgi:hypothetical protein